MAQIVIEWQKDRHFTFNSIEEAKAAGFQVPEDDAGGPDLKPVQEHVEPLRL